MFFQSILEVLPRRYDVALAINKLESEVPQDPEERREILSKLICISRGRALLPITVSYLELFGEVDNKRQVVQHIFINASDAVIDQMGTEEKSQQEDLGVVVVVLVEGP